MFITRSGITSAIDS